MADLGAAVIKSDARAASPLLARRDLVVVIKSAASAATRRTRKTNQNPEIQGSLAIPCRWHADPPSLGRTRFSKMRAWKASRQAALAANLITAAPKIDQE